MSIADEMDKFIYTSCVALLNSTKTRRERALDSDTNHQLYAKVVAYVLWVLPSLISTRLEKYHYTGIRFFVGYNGDPSRNQVVISFDMGDGFGILIQSNEDGSYRRSFHT